jgi:hypothetical protein
MDQGEKRDGTNGKTRRIIVSDLILDRPRKSEGRRLENPPDTDSLKVTSKAPVPPRVRPSFLIAGLGGCLVLVLVVAVLALKQREPVKTKPQVNTPVVQATEVPVPDQSEESRRIEDDAKQVLRRISRDSKPYSFSENAIKDIQSRVHELSASPNLSDFLVSLQTNAGEIGVQSGKVGLQPSLVILLALALTRGGETGDPVKAANRVLPLLTSLNKTFGSSEADSCLILIAASHEGPGTKRSHPLLRRMNRAVTNPLTERNVWYLHDHNIISADAYGLVVNTIAYGVIARNPRQFGIQSDPLSF